MLKPIKVYRKNKKQYDIKYKAYCPSCKKDRGYKCKVRLNKLCKSCSGKQRIPPSSETRKKMSLAKINKIPANKGKKMTTEQRNKLSNLKLGKEPSNKGKTMTYEQKVKLSCINQNIDIDDFIDFTTPTNKRERDKFKKISAECLKRADYTCDIYGVRGIALNAHHLDSWHSNKDKRFDLDNLVCISEKAHKEFHILYGRKNNTRKQYDLFKKMLKKYLS